MDSTNMHPALSAPSFVWGSRTYIMGIVNCSPDSFSGDGITDHERAIEHGMHLVQEGADLLDIGGESTRPGASRVPADQELERVLPVVEQLAQQANVPISVDTSRAVVARAALSAGASIVNDVWALARDPEMASLIAESRAGIVLMHNRAAPAVVGALGGHYQQVEYDNADILDAVGAELEALVARAEMSGITRSNIIIDPGIGFGKSVDQNLELLRRLGELKIRPGLEGLPLLLGASRKSVIGLTLNLPVGERLEGTLATLALAVAQGADIVRVHDVRAAVRGCRMADAIVRRDRCDRNWS
jgi:dihydropteroate synthase